MQINHYVESKYSLYIKTHHFALFWILQKGPNKEPIMASLVVTFVAILFIFIGHVNQLGPIVTMPFLLTYAAMDYAYFALAMSYSKNKESKEKEKDSLLSHVIDKNMADGKASPYQYGQPGRYIHTQVICKYV